MFGGPPHLIRMLLYHVHVDHDVEHAITRARRGGETFPAHYNKQNSARR